MLADCLWRGMKYSLEEIQLVVELDFYCDYLVFAVFYLYIDPVEFVVFVFFVAFAFENLKNLYVVKKKLGKKTLKNFKVCFASKKFFYRPVKRNELSFRNFSHKVLL